MRHWLRGGKEDQAERIADLVKFGVSEAEAREFVGGEVAEETFAVFPQNQQALGLFLRLKHCWRLHPFNCKPLGLDYGQMPAVMAMMGIRRKDWPWLFEQISVCERVVLDNRNAD